MHRNTRCVTAAENIHFGDRAYALRSITCFAPPWHYVTYVRDGDYWIKYDDERVLLLDSIPAAARQNLTIAAYEAVDWGLDAASLAVPDASVSPWNMFFFLSGFALFKHSVP